MFRRLAPSPVASGSIPGHARPASVGPCAVTPSRREGRAPDDLTPRQRRAVVIAMLLLHAGAAAWLVLLPARPALNVVPVTPLKVDWIAAPDPAPEPPPPSPPAPPPTPVPPRITPPQRAPLIAAPEAVATPTAMAPTPALPVIESPPDPVEIIPAPAPAPASTAAAVVAAPPPKMLPAEAVQYLVPPAPVYPKLSRRYGEAGRVLVRVYIDEGGVPRAVQVSESSGHARLDDAARVAVQATRFKPYAENGRPTAGWAFIPLTFDLEP